MAQRLKVPPKLCVICVSRNLKETQEPCKTCLTLPVGKDKFSTKHNCQHH